MKYRVIIILIFIVATGTSFLYDANPFKPTYKKLIIPKGWPKPSIDIFAKNPLTEEGIALGRKMFYDSRLSKDSNFACASCHQQFAAFSNFDHDFSHGVNNHFTKRNAPPIFNLAWMKELHWDGAINHLEVQPLAPLSDTNEMAETLPNVLQKLKRDTSYLRMFKEAFGDPVINSQRMLKALAQFTGSIQSYNTKYDKVQRGEDSFTISEAYGYKVFKAKCNDCHKEPLFTDFSFRNNGLKPNEKWLDAGKASISGNAADSFKFKVPSLRNIWVTGPYMHDGRFYTLSQVIDHYRSKLDTTQKTLDVLLRHRLAISNQEKVDLTSFLTTLSDYELFENKAYGDPLVGKRRLYHEH